MPEASAPTPESHAAIQPPSAGALDQLLSFVTHDVYAPASMLRTYLQAVHSSARGDEGLRDMVADAEGLARELEVLLRLLQDRLRLTVGRLPLQAETVDLVSLVSDWAAGRSGLHWEASGAHRGELAVQLDSAVLLRILEDVVFQMRRMGNRQGPVAIQVTAAPAGASVCLWRTDGQLEADLLERALTAGDEDWSTFLRRLPASGFPLRVAAGLVSALGGKASVRREPPPSPVLVLEFSQSSG